MEFLPGDDSRRCWLGFSEAQWTSSIVAGIVPPVSGGILAAMVFIALLRNSRYRLFLPHHVKEVAQAIAISERTDSAAVAATSLGVRISHGCGCGLRHYT
jgi:hypothetical protein